MAIDEYVGKVWNMDALELLKRLPDASVDVLITDLPYNVGKAEWDYIFPIHWIAEAWRVTGRMLVMSGRKEMIKAGATIGHYQECIVMQARNGMARSQICFGNWFPVLVFGEWQWKARPNHISFNVSMIEKVGHPSPKPLQAMMKLLQHYTEPDWIICDPFAGSGTTGIAARNLGRQYILGDTSAEYCAMMEKRLALPYTPNMFAALEANG